ncbi:MAG: 4Fe-4S binding protein [Caldimicrobium sp.]|nr:4Fe-4S binding protein [Caldimicrobium sp.]MCX7872841.1 4Fe-4S binding protein [Caldimicrobium sp.]MDW8093580.1 4Fe-4S binding protein [Caldimicrobium sp.]
MKIFKLRKITQTFSTIIHNGYGGFLFTGNLYTGPLKGYCAPGLNCYSCPAALFSCPLGALQQLMISLRVLTLEQIIKVFFYLLGTLLLFSLFFGRFICGWLCPFGFLQDLIYKLPFPKKSLDLPKRSQKYLKHFFLIFFVFLFPALFLTELGYGILWYCKYFCPAGTLEAGYFNFPLKPELTQLIGKVFLLKTLIFIIIILLCVIDIRFFCKNLCPLGLLYGLFNRFSIWQLRWNERACNQCSLCERVCPMNLTLPKELNGVECIRCLQCLELCPTKAIGLERTLYYLPQKYQINLSLGVLRYEKKQKN